MTFEELLDQAIAMLQRRGRVAYSVLKRQFDLDDHRLEDLKDAIIFEHPVVEEAGRGLVWTGATAPVSTSHPTFSTDERTTRPLGSVRPQEDPPRAYTPPYLMDKILTSRAALEGERKQVTVLFADIKGSTELIEDLDPEAAQRLLDPALHHMMDAVHCYEGTVNQVLGDGIMALFGAPVAHEDHAVRACYAALAMQAAMQRYTDEVRRTHGQVIQIRVGMNSGEVVVRSIGSDLHMDYSAVGQTTHLAARMEQVATPGSIIMTAGTLRLVEGLVRAERLGPIAVKGVSDPVEVFELMGASAIRRRLQAVAIRGLTQFVGRDMEMQTLTQMLERAGAAQGQVVAAVGEAGVGKSRLIYEFIQSHHTQSWRVLESASVSYGKATPYFPVIELLKHYVHVEDGDEPRTIRAKVTGHILTLDETLQDTLPALLYLLDVLPEDSPFLQLDPTQRRQRTLEGLKRILLRESEVQPLVLVFEDLHWIDSETQALLDRLVESLPTTQLLLLVNYRPEYQHDWGSKTCYTQLRLDPLAPESADVFLETLLGSDTSLKPLKTLLIDRTQGNPFFLEESVRSLVETQVLVGEPGGYRLTQDLPAIVAPATVQAVLAARIDRLSPEDKQLVQTAAVIGTEVPLSLLQAIADLPEDMLRRGLTRLQAAEFLYETSLYPDREYTFKHALTHEVAYSSLLQDRRRILHARIVESLEALAGDRVVDHVERLAHHALRGEVWTKALAYCRQAGEKAMARPAYREAVAYFEQALSALRYLPEQRDTLEQAIDLRLALRSALFPSGDYTRFLAYLHEAESLAVAIDDPRRLGQVSLFLSNYFHVMGAHDQAIAAAQRALALVTASGDVVRHALANRYLGEVYQAQGDYGRAIDCFGQTVAALDGARRRERFGQVVLPAVLARAYLATCHAELGTFAEGSALGEEGRQIAEAVAHPASLMLAYWGTGFLSLRQGDLPKALSLLERAMSICHDADLPILFPRVAAALGTAYTLGGRVADAVPLLIQAMERTTAMNMRGLQALCSLPLGEAYMLAGCLEEAQALTDRELTLARPHQERGQQAYALRLLGDIAMYRDPPKIDQAETSYQQALALSNELSMRPLQAHCYHGLGRLYSQAGQAEQAYTALSMAIQMYRDMEMMFWLPKAEATLTAI